MTQSLLPTAPNLYHLVPRTDWEGAVCLQGWGLTLDSLIIWLSVRPHPKKQLKQPLLQLLILPYVLENEVLVYGWPQVLEKYREFPAMEIMVLASLTESQEKIMKGLE